MTVKKYLNEFDIMVNGLNEFIVLQKYYFCNKISDGYSWVTHPKILKSLDEAKKYRDQIERRFIRERNLNEKRNNWVSINEVRNEKTNKTRINY